MKILEDLTPLNRVFCSSDYDKAIDYFKRILPFRVIEYSSEEDYNGWVIPPKWDVKEAKIIRDGRVIYDGMQSPLSVIALSKSFQGRVDLQELKKHMHFDHRYDDAVPLHFRQQYRSWDRDWGVCVPKTLYDNLLPGDYDVIIEADEAPGSLKLLELTHRGALDETIVIMAHLDHPGTANDGLSGCAVGVELFRRLMERKTRFTYRLFLHQEVIGSEYYLGMMPKFEREKMIEGLFLEMLGAGPELALQSSFNEGTNIEYCLGKVLERSDVAYRRGGYGDIVVNGEYIWQAYGIPVASLSRFPYPEYHTDRDNFSIVSEASLNEALQVMISAIDDIESFPIVLKLFDGTLCLSNPIYDLYEDPGQAAFGDQTDDLGRKMRLLMDLIPTLIKPVSTKILAERVGLEENIICDYLRRWAAKGLLVIK